MYRFTRSLIALTGLLALVGIATLGMPHNGRSASGTSSGAPSSQTQNVNVVNTPTVQVSNFPATTNVAITGTPTVGLDSGNNTVKIDTSSPVLVRDVDNPARQPFQTSVFVSLPDGTSFVASDPNLLPPAGKRLVLEQVSIGANLPTGQKPACSLVVKNNFADVIFDQALPISLQATFGPVDTFQASLPTRLYIDSSESVALDVFRTATTGSAGVRVSFSGYLVDLP